MTVAYINQIGTAVPDHDIHVPFVAFARTLLTEAKTRAVFDRMVERSGIAHRYSFFAPGDLSAGEVDAGRFYQRGRFPGTAARMARYATEALALAMRAVDALALGDERARITHLVVASCTGFTAPGLDLQLAGGLGLRADVARTLIGFMGCAAAVPALRAARDAVRADPAARVLVVNLELSSLHMQETSELETVLSFLLFGDGASAALVTADATGIALGAFHAMVIPDSAELITWTIGDQGFLMHLSGKVPGRIAQTLRDDRAAVLRGDDGAAIDVWAVHGGGRTVLDAVEIGLSLDGQALRHSRAVLRDYGNMSSATVMFVLARLLDDAAIRGRRGLAMAFGPGMVAETFWFQLAGG